jgi:hypothetical protein
MYIMDNNPSWKVNQRKKEKVLDPRVTNIASGGHKQKGLILLLFFCFCIWYVVEPNYGFYTTGRESADGGLYWR